MQGGHQMEWPAAINAFSVPHIQGLYYGIWSAQFGGKGVAFIATYYTPTNAINAEAIIAINAQ